ncbi:MAG: tRNA (N6-isopentenyl adenosine(37)-C2)-methylthiotransferase MiaB [Bacteroidetes bacterium]|nr:tRNA (N6-isopentenyl adenosine(37)-C2)-methylthiotransferase MiaB [Bacteroidota bacterium]MBX7238235.1 tRNA (N6-isopentenyl adenosine(37)-C2)-methylthiotransferase MiaB [Bacteroidia bacterium]MCC7515047.1 tRNA (N6-isopentenyl adenosine(37)-C2)-methylthiotransferase MiaB [Bacteroidia bacterium]MCW5918934.1 tRNA (N6-isopentenyl adenosine(37)-C2)-methylthiotransferase MiaB [Bacteroidota bacterium]HMU77175.1 tRNA (N6-isopentenyl adenosine(37)-C2)-methylthiotransferase MiaB [Bacteroidia bacterium
MHNDIKVIDESRQGEPTMLQSSSENLSPKKLYLESYGCQMNFADSEIVASILKNEGFETTKDVNEADAVFINTCAIRDNAEQRVRTRLKDFKKIKKENPDLIVGVLGCMAERIKSQFLEEEKLVDIVVGPDAYRDLPLLIEKVEDGQKAVNVILSKEETYADITPVRLGNNGVTAFVSIMRGCDNMCSFCVVPFTRGRERSRDPQSIIKEVEQLYNEGYREVTLLGQNVDSYLWKGGGLKKDLDTETVHLALNHKLPPEQQKDFVTFSNLLEMVADVNPDMRVRFSTSNPRDMTDAVLHSMAKYENICKYIHLPVQSGSSSVLEKMNRGYTREDYIARIESIKRILPECGISTDIIAGFCSETEEEHQETISLMEQTIYDFAFMFVYSERPGTFAERKFTDDVLPEVKTKRLNEIVALQQKHSAIRTNQSIGKVYKVLIEGVSKKSDEMLMGRNSQNTVVVFPKNNHKPGEYVHVKVNKCTSTTLIGEVV